jgi:hypothetical protein
MNERPKPGFPATSLLAAMLGERAPVDVRRAAQRLRAEGAPALAVEDGIAELARGLALSEVSRSPALLDVLPPLFWIEARAQDPAAGIGGWVVERKGAGLALRGFRIAFGPEAVPEPAGTATLAFGAAAPAEAPDLRGLIAAVALPELMAQMGESSPILLLPAEAPADQARLLRGFRLSVAIPPDQAPM